MITDEYVVLVHVDVLMWCSSRSDKPHWAWVKHLSASRMLSKRHCHCVSSDLSAGRVAHAYDPSTPGAEVGG